MAPLQSKKHTSIQLGFMIHSLALRDHTLSQSCADCTNNVLSYQVWAVVVFLPGLVGKKIIYHYALFAIRYTYYIF